MVLYAIVLLKKEMLKESVIMTRRSKRIFDLESFSSS